MCDAFSVEELLGALRSSSEGRGNNGTAITNIKERLRSSNNNNEKFLTLKGVPNKELFALQVSLMRIPALTSNRSSFFVLLSHYILLKFHSANKKKLRLMKKI